MATPPTAATVVVPDSVPPPGFVPIASVTFPVNDGIVVPVLSTTRTVTAGDIGAPACSLVGCWANTSRLAVGETPVNVTVALSAIA